jgi:hypothetical protein
MAACEPRRAVRAEHSQCAHRGRNRRASERASTAAQLTAMVLRKRREGLGRFSPRLRPRARRLVQRRREARPGRATIRP